MSCSRISPPSMCLKHGLAKPFHRTRTDMVHAAGRQRIHALCIMPRPTRPRMPALSACGVTSCDCAGKRYAPAAWLAAQITDLGPAAGESGNRWGGCLGRLSVFSGANARPSQARTATSAAPTLGGSPDHGSRGRPDHCVHGATVPPDPLSLAVRSRFCMSFDSVLLG